MTNNTRQKAGEQTLGVAAHEVEAKGRAKGKSGAGADIGVDGKTCLDQGCELCAGRVVCKVLLGLFLLVSLSFGLVIVRVSVAPMDLNFLATIFEDAMSNETQGYSVRLGDIRLGRTARGEVVLKASDTRIMNAQGSQMMLVADMSLGARWGYLLLGQFRPQSIVFDGPTLRVNRNEEGRFRFEGFGGAGSEDAVESYSKSSERSDEALIIRDILAQLGGFDPAEGGRSNRLLQDLVRFEISRASVHVEDDMLLSAWSVPRFDVVFMAQDQGGLKAAADVYLQHGAMDRNSVHAQMVFPKDGGDIEAQLVLKKLASRLLQDNLLPLSSVGLKHHDVLLEGSVDAEFSYDLDVRTALLDLESPVGSLNLDLYKGRKLPYEDMAIRGQFHFEDGLKIDQIGAKVAGVDVSLSGHVKPDKAYGAAGAYHGRFRLDIPQMRRADFRRLWPQDYHYIGAYKWLGDKLYDGVYKDLVARAGFRYEPPAFEAPDEKMEGEASDPIEDSSGSFTFEGVSADFDFSDMSIAYNDKMPHVTNAYGSGRFDYHSELLRIDVDRAKVAGFAVKNSLIELAHFVESKHGWADIFLAMEGALPDVFRLLQDEPVGLKHDYDLARMRGLANMRINLQMPVFGDPQMEDMDLDVRAFADDVLMPAVFKGVDLTSASANVVLNGNRLSIKGSGGFLGQELSFDYRSFLKTAGEAYKDKISVSGLVDNAGRDRLGIDLADLIDGAIDVDATYVNYHDKRASLDLEADLKPARLFIEPLGYDKPAGQEGYASLQGVLKGGEMVSINGLDVRSKALRVRDGVLSFDGEGGALSKIDLPKALVGDTRGSMEIRFEPSGLQRLSADLESLDARAILGKDKNGKKGQKSDGLKVEGAGQAVADKKRSPMIASVSAKKMLTHEDRFVTSAKIYFDMDAQKRFNQLEMDGFAGQGSVYLRFKPDDAGRQIFRFEADDAGATLAAFGAYKDIRGGSILVHGEPKVEGGRDFSGVAEIKDFRVVGAPVLAKLLSLASLEGLTDGLANEGIEFKRLETKFDWDYHEGGSLVTLSQGRTSGAAIGLTFDGTVDQASNVMDISGTVVPMSQLNSLIGAIPIVGEVLTGGTGIIAATYKVRTKDGEPDVSINPLSVLAPGIIRRVLFE